MLLQNLPIEVLHTLCYFLTGSDITNLSKCNQALWVVLQDESLWAQLTCDRFPTLYTSIRNEQCQDHNTLEKKNWQDTYMSKDLLCISAVNDMSITNARLPFWRIVGTKESRYGAIAKLYSICMLDIRGKVEGAPKGRYRIQWRMRFALSAQWNESLDFTAHVGNEATPASLTYTTPTDFYSRQDILTNTWICITLPGELVVNKRFDTVTLVHGKKTNFWKSGIEIDWARLVPSTQVQDQGLVLEHEFKHWHLDKIAYSLPSTTAYSFMRRHLGSTNF
ncbi:hypothetical protein K492DRAFT_207203 [Lichtheimia hyalospora FSU 10163]|nr:hypothetical protein K492DRAFT_207203 [Lichtheimia hyalospora FSU 10163]